MLKYRREFRRFHKSIWGAVALLVLLGFLLQNVTGSVYYSLVIQSGAAVSDAPVELQEGTAGTSTIYTNKTSALVSTVASTPTPTYYPNNYNVVTGAHLSGSVPASVQTVDSDYFIVRSSGTANSTTAYNPSGYNLVGNTKLVSGTTSDLISNNSVYMTFRSYDSATSAQALYAHQETTTIGGPTYYLLKRSSADAAGTTLSADAGTTTGRKLMGKFVCQLTGISSIPTSTWTIYYRAYKGHNQIAAHGDVDILIRMSNGTVRTTIATNVANSGALTISWSTVSGTYSWAAYTVVNQTDYLEIDYYIEVTTIKAGYFVYLRIDDNTLAVADQTRATNIYLPSEYTCEAEFTGSSNTYTWAQLVWTIDSAWTTGSITVTIQVYNYTLGGYPTSGNGYDSYVSSATADTDETKTQTTTINPQHFRDGSGNWKIKVKGVKSSTTQFDFKADWVEFKPAHYSEYTVSTEFLFSTMTENTPTQLNFTVVSQYNITNVNVTIQVWNYSSSAYVTSDEGYLNYTSSGSNETKLLSINTNPQFYTSNGNAKIKITGILSTTTQYQQETNQVKLLYNYSSSSDYDHVLKVVNKDPNAWKVRLKAYDNSSISRLNNCTIYIHGTQSQPITNMNFTSNADGWSSAHSYNGTTGPELTWTEVTWDSDNGNPSPGSAGGSAYGGASESHGVKYWGTIIYNFSYTFTAPTSGWTSVKASFAWKFNASGTYTNNKLNAVKLLLTDNSDVVLEELYVDDNGGSGWTGQASVGYYYRTDLTVSANMTAGNSYKLKVQFVDTDTTGSDTPSVTFRIDDISISFDYGNSNQIVIINGSYTQQTGLWYDLAVSGTIYIAMHVEASNSDTSYVYAYLEIRVPNSTVYAQYTIIFKIT